MMVQTHHQQQMFLQSPMFYAHWVQNVTVTFHENYGQTENTTNKTISAGSSLKSSDIPTFTRADYAFKEWNTKADGSGTTYSNTQLQAETIQAILTIMQCGHRRIRTMQ